MSKARAIWRPAYLLALGALGCAVIGCGDLIDQHDIATHPAVIGHVASMWFPNGRPSPVMWARIDFQPDPGSPAVCSGPVRVPDGVRFTIGQAVSVVPHANGCTPVLVQYAGHGSILLALAAVLGALSAGCVVLCRRGRRAQAVRYARGEDVPGLIVHAPQQTATDLALDAHKVQPAEYDELPELTDEDMARGTLMKGGKSIMRPRKQEG